MKILLKGSLLLLLRARAKRLVLRLRNRRYQPEKAYMRGGKDRRPTPAR